MIYLLIVSIIWAFSFGLIKGNLTNLDPNLVSFLRLGISFIVFAPFIRFKNVNLKFIGKLMLIGALQFGVMYISYIYSFKFLKAYEVALFTIFTPIYVTLLNDIFNKKFNKKYLLTALLSVLGTAIIKYQNLNNDIILGFLIIQISNLAFAFGQIYYKKVMADSDCKDKEIFGFVYLGAVFVTLISSLITVEFSQLEITSVHIWTILYLGSIASGLCFFLWNYGARLVNSGTLAVFNNLKIPIAVLVSLFVFGEQGNLLMLFIGGIIVLAALFLSERVKTKS